MSSLLEGIFVYPFKSLAGQSLNHVTLIPQRGIPGDRRFALARPETAYNPDQPSWISKHELEVLASDPRLSRLGARFENDTLSITWDDAPLATATRAEKWQAVTDALHQALGQPIRLIEAPPGGHLADQEVAYVSLITTASLEALSQTMNETIDPRRFRANLLIRTDEPFGEREWIGKTLQIGEAQTDSAELHITKHTTRCIATHAHPQKGVYDIDILKALRRHYGHRDFGVFAKVTRGGTLSVHDTLTIHDPSL